MTSSVSNSSIRQSLKLSHGFNYAYALAFIKFPDTGLQLIYHFLLDVRIDDTYAGNMTAREMLKLLHNDGWFVYEQNGSHIQLKHSAKKGRVTVPNHKGDLKKGTCRSILKQAGLE